MSIPPAPDMCFTCRFWVPYDTEVTDKDIGLCVYGFPQALEHNFEGGVYFACWPSTYSDMRVTA